MARLENKCTNCADRGSCRWAQGVVEWKHCGSFRPDILLMQRLRRYEEDRRAVRLNYVEREPELRPKKGDAVEMLDREGRVLMRFENIRAAEEETGFSRGQIYNRVHGLSVTMLRRDGQEISFRWAPERKERKERAYDIPLF